MTWKIQLQWVLLLHIFSLLWTTVVQASIEVRTDNLRRDSRNSSSGIVNANIRGHIERFLKRVVREADDILEVLNSAATTKSSDVFVLGEIEELELLWLSKSQNIQMYIWNKTLFSGIIDDSQNLKILSLDLNGYKTTLIAEIHKVTNCDMTAVSEGKLIITCIGSQLVEGDGNVKTYILEQSVAGSYDLQYIHLIEARGFSHISMWHQQGEIMLMICSMTSPTAFDTSVTGQSNLYRWTGAYFDNIQVFSPANASASHHFVISNQHFIAEAHFANSKGHHNCYSYIYRYSAASKMYIPLQLLPTKGAKHFTSFVLNASGRSNVFLAVANSCQDDHGGKCNPFTTSGIYCYHHDRFVLFQEIPTANAIQWLAIEVENNVLLAVANALTGVKVYQYNGWRFVPAESQFTQGSFGIGVTGLAGVKLEEKIILGGVNGNSLRELPVFFEVKLKRENFFQTYHDDLDKWCSARLRSVEESTYPDARAVTVPLSNSSKYSFNKSINIDGDLIVLQQGNVDKVLLRSTNIVMPGVPVGLSHKINSLKERSKLIADTMKRTIPITGNVTWPAKLHFRSLDSASSKSINVVDDVIGHFLQANGLSINDDNLALLDDGRVISRLNISQVEVKADVKVNTLGGHPFIEYATLSGEHTFKKDVIFVENFDVQEVNAAKIISETAPGHQRYLSVGNINFKDYFHCSSASATRLECQTLNGINVSKLQEDVIITGEYNFVRGKLEVDGNLTYRGNLQSNVMGSINLETPLKLNSFNRPKISGSHRILTIKMNWLEGQSINGIHVPEQLLVNRSDSSYVLEKANFPKVSAQSIFVESNLDTIKVRNGSLDVMKVSEDQFVTSRKAFKTIRLSSQSLRRNKRAASADNQVRDKSLVSPDNLYKHFGWDESLIKVANFVRREAELSNLVKLLHTASGGNILIPSCYLNYFQVLKKLYYLPSVYTNADELLGANCAINSKNSWKLQSIPVSQDDIDSVTYNSKLYKSRLNDRLKEVNFKRNIPVMSKISKVNLIPAVKKHLQLMELLLSALRQILNSSKTSTKVVERDFESIPKAPKMNEEKSDILYFLCDTVRQIGHYPAILRRHIGSSSKTAVIESALIDLVVIQFLSSAPEYGDIYYLLRKPPSCHNFEDITYFVGVSKILHEFQDLVNSTSLNTSIRYKRDPENEETFLQYGKESGKVSRGCISSTGHDFVTKVESWNLNYSSVRYSAESVMDGTHEGSLPYSPEAFSSKTSLTNHQQSHFMGFSSFSLDVADFEDSSLVSMIAPINWVDRSSDRGTFALDYVGSGTVSVPMFSSEFSKIAYGPTTLMSGVANFKIDILNSEIALTVKRPLSGTAAYSLTEHSDYDYDDYDNASDETAHTGKQLLNNDYDYIFNAGAKYHLGLYSNTAITMEQPLSETITYLIISPSAYNDFVSNVQTKECSGSLTTVLEEESTVNGYFSHQKDFVSFNALSPVPLNNVFAISSREHSSFTTVKQIWKTLAFSFPEKVGIESYSGETYSASNLVTVPVDVSTPFDIHPSSPSIDNLEQSSAEMSEYGSVVAVYSKNEKLEAGCISCETTVKETWKTPAISFPDKVGMEGYNGEISENFGFTYSASNLVTVPVDVSPSFDIHPSSPGIEDLEESSAETSEYDPSVESYRENEKLIDGCISCDTSVKEILWKTEFSSTGKVGMEGYHGEKPDNFMFMYSASNLVTVPLDVSTPIDILHPSSPSIDDLEQSPAEMSEYGSVVAVYSKKEKLEAGCVSCETTVKETWKAPAITSADKVGMEGYNGEISENFGFTYSASNLVTVPVDVSPSFDIHPSSPGIEDLEESSAETSEYDPSVESYRENEKLLDGCISCDTSVKEIIWKTPAFSSPDKVVLEGYNREKSDGNFVYMYSASNLVTVPLDVSPSFDIHPSSQSVDDLEQSSAEMSEYGSVVAVYSKKEKLEAGCVSCETTVKETWKVPAITYPDKIGMEGYNGEISENFGFTYSASNLVTVPVDVSPSFDIHPSSPGIEDLEESSAETSEYDPSVESYRENKKLLDGCISCDTTVKEIIWKTPAFSSSDKVGMEGYDGEKSDDNFVYMYSASNLVTVPLDVSPSFDIHPSSQSVDDLEQSSAEMSEYGSVVAVYSKKEKLEAGCVSCETTVKETWKTPAISSADKVGMEGYNGEISENFGFTYSASNHVTMPVDVSPSFDIHPSSPGIEDLEESSAETSEYDPRVESYRENEKLIDGCISCDTTVKEIPWKTPVLSSLDKVGLEGYNGERSDGNFMFMYSASNLVTVPLDVSTPFDIRPSSPSIDDLEQSSATMSKTTLIVEDLRENGKLLEGCISCDAGRSLDVSPDTVKAIDISSRESILEHSSADSIFAIYYTDVLTNYAVGEVTKTLPISEEGRGFIPQRIHSFNEPFSVSLSEETLDLAKPSNRYDSVPSPMYVLLISGIDRNLQDFPAVTTAVKSNYPEEVTMLSSQLQLVQESKVPLGNMRERYLNEYLNQYKTAMNSYDSEISVLPIDYVYPAQTTLTELFPSSTLDIIPSLSDKVSPEYSSFLNWQQHIINSKEFSDDYMEQSSLVSSLFNRRMNAKGIVKYGTNNSGKLTESSPISSSASKYDTDDASSFTTVWRSSIVFVDIASELSSSSVKNYPSETVTHKQTVDVTGKYESNYKAKSLHSETKNKSILLKGRQGDSGTWKENVFVLKTVKDLSANYVNRSINTTIASSFESTLRPGETPSASVIVMHSMLPPAHSHFHVSVPSEVSSKCHGAMNTYMTQHRTYIKCISCTFIFKSYIGIVPSTLLVQNFPVTKTQDQHVDDLNEPLEFEEVDFNQFQITTFASDRVTDVQYSAIDSSVPSVTHQDTISKFTHISMVNVATAYDGYNYHDFSEDMNERNIDDQHSTSPASTTYVESESATYTTAINAVKVGRAYGDVHHELSEDATTTDDSTTKQPEYFVSDVHLENIVNYINEFRRFASHNFSQSSQYSEVVGKNIEVILNCSYNYFWTLRHKFASMISNYSYFDDCKKRLEFVQKLSGHYAFSPNDVILLTTIRDAPWLNELISILDIKLRKSRGQPVTVEEEVKFKNIAETDNKTLSSPPPMVTIVKEAIYGKINKISNVREMISRFMKRQNKGHISRLIREAVSVPYDILHLSDELGKYSKEDPLYIVTHREAFLKLVEDYFRFKTYYFSHSGIHSDEIDKLLKKNDVLLEIFEHDLAHLENNEKSKLNDISDRLHNNTVQFPSLKRRYFSLSLDEPTSQEKMLLEYYCNLDEMLYTFIFEAINGSNLSEDLHAIVNEMQENMDVLSDYIQSFYKNQHDLPLRSEEKLGIRINWNKSSNVNEKVLAQWQGLSGDIASICKSVMTLNGLQKADCSGVSKQVLGNAFSLDALNVSRVLKYLKSINFLLRDINEIDIVNEDAGLHVNLTDCLLNVLTTTKSIFSDIHLSHKHINSDTLWNQESCLNATIGFSKKPASTFVTSQFFQNLDYLKPLILYTFVETKHAIDCLEALDLEYENRLNQPPVILHVPLNAQNSSYENTTIFEQTVDHSASHSARSSFLCDRDVGHLEYLLNLTRKIIRMNPMNKTKVLSKSKPPDSIAVSSTANDVLLTLNSIINYLQQCTSRVSLDDLDELLKNHQLLMKDIEGHISPLSDEAKLKVLMIYGESLGGRAAVAENLILRDIEKGNLTAESEGEFEVFGFFVHGRVAKYDLKELSVLPSPLSPASATSLKYINENMNKLSRVIIQGGLFVSTMNEVNVEHLTQHAVPVSRISVYGNIHFKQKVAVVGDMNVQRINGLMAENFVLCKGNPEFSLPVTFMKDIHVDGNVALTDLINDMDISSFSKRIVLTNSRHIVIEKDVIFTSLKAERVNSLKIKISGVPLEKVVKKGEVSVLTGNKTFLSLQVADSTRFSALDVQYINDLNIPVMFRDSLWKNSDEQQMITYVGHLRTCHVNNSLTTRGISYLSVHNNYSTVHLPRFFKNVIYSDKEVVVSRVIIRGNANVLSLIFFNTLDGTASDTFSNGWLLKTADQTVSGKIYAADVSSYSVAVRERGTIFDVDIELLNRAVKVNESITFIRDINVARLLSNRSISVEGLVQSMNIPVESISKLDEVVIITAPKLFLVSTFAKTISLSGLLNSIHLGKHCHTSSSRNISIIGNVHLIHNTFSQSLKFDSNFINENFLEVYWHKDRNVEIRFKMTFKHVSVVEINATVNNVDLRGLDSKVLHRTCNDWNRLQGQSYIKNLITKALLTKSVLGSTLNGIAIESFSNLLQKIGNQVFTGNVTLNRISVEGNVSIGPRSLSNISRLCRYQEICVISAVKYFDSYVTVKGNIVVDDDKTLQGVDISDIFVNVLSDLGHVFGTTEFKGNVRLSALGVNGHVDSITVTKETLLLRAGSQVMSGLVTVNSSLARAVTTPEIKTDEWSVGLMDVSELSVKAVHQEINNILHSPVFFENEVKFNFGDMELEHMTAGLQAVDPEIVFGALKNLSFLNQKTVRGQVLELKGWQQVQVFEEPIERIMPVDLTVQSSSVRFTPKEEYLALVSSVGNTRILTRNFTQQHFNDPGISLEGGCAQKVIGYTTEYSYNLLTSHSCPINYQPEDDRMRVWEFNPQDTPFVKLSQNIRVTGITDMDVVALDDKVCVLIAGNEKDRVSLYCQGTEQFVSVNSIEEGGQKLSALHPSGGIGNNITLFAVASQGKYPQERGYFAVLSYDFIDRKFSRIQKIELEIVVWVDMIFHQNKVFIAVVSQSRSGNHLGQVNVYRIDLDPGRPSTLSRRVHIHQQILVKNPFEAHFSKLDSRLSLFIIDQNGYISWYSQKGIQRFSEVGKLHMAGKQQLEVWLSHINESYSHWVAVSGEDCNYKESVYNRKDTQIIQSVLRGRQFLP